ncbi:uncharacterized protein AB675_10222 [Cyphellophora attinorum]|uniref:Uncharacterized protein n=1 Tax=Cyphellophora attinorum TaxID=1664694 RepID=A0A0N1H655_9EURO|nr:uncharacterized protein AB675_10222 [Phialophora attinorum]KPI37492.1 hypothetical protein AB675_10222 [Phialophora attinorum]
MARVTSSRSAAARAPLPTRAAKGKPGYSLSGTHFSRHFRDDGRWHRCPINNCKFVAKDELELTGRGHYRDFHGFKIVSRGLGAYANRPPRQQNGPRVPHAARCFGFACGGGETPQGVE